MGASYCAYMVIICDGACVERCQTGALHSATVTHGCHSSSYQKKILESRLAEADGLSFPSFLRASIPLETVTGTWLLSLEPLQGDSINPERSAAVNREGRQENPQRHRGHEDD